jgi:NADP-dependent 3-hydroxy acid dehydrogenase YdfG
MPSTSIQKHQEKGTDLMQHQTALVAGASGGIGRAVATDLTRLGIRTALLGRDREKLENVRAALGDAGQAAVIATCDVTDRAQVGTAVTAVLSALGSIDVLVCSAGINVRQRSLRSLDPADWDRLIGTNLTGTFNLIHAVLPSMRTQGNGLVIQIASISGIRASTLSGAAYSVSKFGQAALGICLGREERGRGIKSSVIHPGEVNTPFLELRAGRPGGGDTSRSESILQPEDIAAAVRFLVELPPRAHVPELVIKPTIDDFS